MVNCKYATELKGKISWFRIRRISTQRLNTIGDRVFSLLEMCPISFVVSFFGFELSRRFFPRKCSVTVRIRRWYIQETNYRHLFAFYESIMLSTFLFRSFNLVADPPGPGGNHRFGWTFKDRTQWLTVWIKSFSLAGIYQLVRWSRNASGRNTFCRHGAVSVRAPSDFAAAIVAPTISI